MRTRYPLGLLGLLLSSMAWAQPFNNNPCQAVALPAGPNCQFQQFNNNGATNNAAGIPNPGCGGYDDSQAQTVWFVTQVPPSGELTIDQSPGTLNNTSMAAYTAPNCGGPFSLVACDADGSDNGNMPRLELTGLTPGSLLFIRVWDFYAAGFLGIGGDPSQQGTFNICVFEPEVLIIGGPGGTITYDCGSTPPAGNTCESSTPICTFDGYCGSTSGYTADYWYDGGQGLGGPGDIFGGEQGIFCGSIENNSFVSFIAGSSTVELEVIVSGSSSQCGDGIQFMMFGDPNGPSCGSLGIQNYGCLEQMPPGVNNFVGTGLVPGQEYYLMVDGFAGDVCDYQINAVSGVVVDVSAGPDRSICLGQSVELNVFGNGNGPVSWTGPFLNTTVGTSVVATPTAPGVYEYIVFATDALIPECNGDLSDTVLVNVSQAQAVTITAGACVDGSITLTASGASNYTWVPAQGINQTSGNSVVVTPTGPITYTVYGASPGGCIIPATISVNVCDPDCNTPQFTVTPPDPVCAPATVDLATAVSGTGTNTVTYHADQAAANAGTPTLPSSTVSSSGTYFVRVEVPGTPTCYSVQSVAVIVVEPGSVSAGDDVAICAGSNVTLNASGATDYTWTPATGLSATTGASVTASPTTTTTYTVTGTTDGCSASATVTVTVNEAPEVDAVVTDPQCGGADGTIELTITSSSTDLSYAWSNGAATAELSDLLSGSYTVTVTDNSSGCTAEATYTLSSTDAPMIDDLVIVDPSCGASDGGITITASGGSGTLQYSVDGGLSFQPSGTFNGLGSGSYALVVSDAEGCAVTENVDLSSEDAPSIQSVVVVDPTCAGNDGSITITAAGGTGDLAYSINGGTDPVPSGDFPSLGPGTYVVVVSDTEGCQSTQTVVLATPELPSIPSVATEAPDCGEANGSITISAANGTPPYQYSIDGGVNSSAFGSFMGLPAGTYAVQVTDAAGCEASDEVVLSSPPVLGQDEASICAGESLFLGGALQTTSGSYQNTFTTAAGCDSIVTTQLTVHPLPVAGFIVTPLTAPVASPTFTVLNGAGSNVVEWAYTWGDGTEMTDPSGQHTYGGPGQYVISQIVTSDQGCVNSFSVTVTVADEFRFYIPNAFTPDGDGVNDFFAGVGTGVVSWEMLIFNRWGELIHTTTNEGQPWDGMAGGEPAQQGVYPYLFRVTNNEAITVEYRGHVTLLR